MQLHQQDSSGAWAEALSRGETVSVHVRGVSMLPWLRDGESVRIQPVAHRLHRGDVVLFRRDATHPVLHRIVGVHGEGKSRVYDCLGDSEYGLPEAVPEASMIGMLETTPVQRWCFRLLNRPRRGFNRVCSRLGIRLRHG